MNGTDWKLEPMREEDLPEVLAIESASFGSPWPPGAFTEELKNRIARLIVAREPEPSGAGRLAGYLCLWILHDELLVNNLAVAPAWRRRGLGGRLVQEAVRLGRGAGCKTAWLEVRPSNVAALRLYEAHGFHVSQRRKQYYGDTGEDALVMSASLKVPETG